MPVLVGLVFTAKIRIVNFVEKCTVSFSLKLYPLFRLGVSIHEQYYVLSGYTVTVKTYSSFKRVAKTVRFSTMSLHLRICCLGLSVDPD